MLILTVVIIFISIFFIIKGASQNKENYLVAGNLMLLLSMIVNIAGSYNFSYRGFITSVIGALIVYGLTVIIIALNIRKKDIIIEELEEQALNGKETTDWIYDAERSELDYSSYHCSCCNKKIVMYDDAKPYKYCPFCGRMYAAKKLEEEHPVK